jgi:hypothetical protein
MAPLMAGPPQVKTPHLHAYVAFYAAQLAGPHGDGAWHSLVEAGPPALPLGTGVDGNGGRTRDRGQSGRVHLLAVGCQPASHPVADHPRAAGQRTASPPVAGKPLADERAADERAAR